MKAAVLIRRDWNSELLDSALPASYHHTLVEDAGFTAPKFARRLLVNFDGEEASRNVFGARYLLGIRSDGTKMLSHSIRAHSLVRDSRAVAPSSSAADWIRGLYPLMSELDPDWAFIWRSEPALWFFYPLRAPSWPPEGYAVTSDFDAAYDHILSPAEKESPNGNRI